MNVCTAQPALACPARGFTLLETLVAISITLVLVLFLNQIFSSMSGAVAAGAGVSDVIRGNQAFNHQLHQDTQGMLGPFRNGFLIVLQHRIKNAPLRAGDPYTADFRSDQVIWVRARDELSPACPAGSADYAPPHTDADHVLVWYGHTLRTDETGAQAPGLGEPGPNAFASQWVLGRQVRFLDPDPAAAHIRAADGFPWRIVGRNEGPAPSWWYKGLSDIHGESLRQIHQRLLAEQFQFGSSDPVPHYQFTYGAQRLWSTPRPPDAAYDPWRMAQMHSYFMPNVSDFRIDFAGFYEELSSAQTRWYSHFYNNLPQILVNEPGWDFDPDEPLTHKPPVVFTPPVIPLLPVPTYDRNPTLGGQPMPHADAAFIFLPTDTMWPQLLRFRYRVHDSRGALTDTDGRPGKLFERIIQVR